MRHLLSIADLSKIEAISILDTANELARVSDGAVKKLPTLRGRTIVNLFAEDSTRTRISFEAAAKRLSADVINFSAKGSSVSKGESLKDTAMTLQAMGADAVVIRHSASGAAQRLADSQWMSGSVVNAGDGTHEHPSQALLDAFTIRKHLGLGKSDLEGLSVAIVGDVLHSRVARSNVAALQTLGCKDIRVIAPNTLLPVGFNEYGEHVRLFNQMDAGVTDCDVIIALRIQNERIDSPALASQSEFYKMYGLNKERLALAKPDCIVMHPGPMNRGVEIDSSVADGDQSVILKQVTNGIAVRMAVLALAMQGQLQEQGLIEAIAL